MQTQRFVLKGKTMSIAERIAAKKAELANKGKAPEEVKVKRGKTKGVKNFVTDEYASQLTELMTETRKKMDELEKQLERFVLDGNKSAAKAVRQMLMDLKNMSNPFRKAIQEAKANMGQKKVA